MCPSFSPLSIFLFSFFSLRSLKYFNEFNFSRIFSQFFISQCCAKINAHIEKTKNINTQSTYTHMTSHTSKLTDNIQFMCKASSSIPMHIVRSETCALVIHLFENLACVLDNCTAASREAHALFSGERRTDTLREYDVRNI